jgi:hypothetical protein
MDVILPPGQVPGPRVKRTPGDEIRRSNLHAAASGGSIQRFQVVIYLLRPANTTELALSLRRCMDHAELFHWGVLTSISESTPDRRPMERDGFKLVLAALKECKAGGILIPEPGVISDDLAEYDEISSAVEKLGGFIQVAA